MKNEKDKTLIWTEKSEKELLKTVVMTVKETESISPEGVPGKYIIMDAPDWVIVIPVCGKNFLMVKQWRHGEKAVSIEFPGGVKEKNETPEEGAKRELLEETGYKTQNLVHLGTINPNPALMKNHVHIFLADNLLSTGIQHLDNDEFVSYFEIPQEEVFQNMGTPQYSHAIMAAALELYRQHLSRT